MDNVFIYQSVELPDFCRSPKGTIAVFFCEWDKLKAAQNRITGKFKHTSQPVNGTCTIKSFNSTDPATGVGFKVLMVEVVKPMPPRKTRGRKLGGKNKKITSDVGITVTPVSHADAVAIVSPDHSGETESGAAAILDKHIDDVTDGKVKLWPLY
jgi:hypothetical protein